MTLTMMSIKTTQKNLTWLNLNSNRGRLTFDFSTQHICLIVIVVLCCGTCCVCCLLASQQQQNITKGEQVCTLSSSGWLECCITNDGKKLKRFEAAEEVFLSECSMFIGL